MVREPVTSSRVLEKFDWFSREVEIQLYGQENERVEPLDLSCEFHLFVLVGKIKMNVNVQQWKNTDSIENERKDTTGLSGVVSLSMYSFSEGRIG